MPAVVHRQISVVQKIHKTMEVLQVQVVEKTVEIPQLQIVEQIVEVPEIQMVQGTQTSESLGTAPVRQVAQAEIGRWSRSERLFLQNLHYPYSSQHPSWKLLQLLLSKHNSLPLQST